MLGVPTGGVLPRTAVIADFVRLLAVETHTCVHATLHIKTFRACARDFRPEPKESAYTWHFDCSASRAKLAEPPPAIVYDAFGI